MTMFYHMLNFESTEPYIFPAVLHCDADVFVVDKNKTLNYLLVLKILSFKRKKKHSVT